MVATDQAKQPRWTFPRRCPRAPPGIQKGSQDV